MDLSGRTYYPSWQWIKLTVVCTKYTFLLLEIQPADRDLSCASSSDRFREVNRERETKREKKVFPAFRYPLVQQQDDPLLSS